MATKLQKYTFILIFFAVILCCKKQEVSIDKSVNKLNNISSIYSMPSKTIIGDISEDKILDTISITAYKDKILGFDFEIKIKYSWKGEWRIKKIQSGRYTCAFDWGFNTVEKWISVGYSTDRGYRDYYDIAFEKSENLFYLKRHVGIYPSSTEKYYDLFGEVGTQIKTYGFKICKTDYDNFAIVDTISLKENKTTKCIELPYDKETSNISIIENRLQLTKLESISK